MPKRKQTQQLNKILWKLLVSQSHVRGFLFLILAFLIFVFIFYSTGALNMYYGFLFCISGVPECVNNVSLYLCLFLCLFLDSFLSVCFVLF